MPGTPVARSSDFISSQCAGNVAERFALYSAAVNARRSLPGGATGLAMFRPDPDDNLLLPRCWIIDTHSHSVWTADAGTANDFCGGCSDEISGGGQEENKFAGDIASRSLKRAFFRQQFVQVFVQSSQSRKGTLLF